MTERSLISDTDREQVVVYGRKLVTGGLTTGTGGNLSVCDRVLHQVAVTPSGIDYADLDAADIVVTDMSGAALDGPHQPSTELGFHLALYRHRPDIGAVVHTHSPYATTMACLHREIPAVHYLVGFAGPKVPLAPYAPFGSPELANAVTAAIGDANAALLANHGLVAVGCDLPAAFAVAEEIEFVARIYYQCLSVGEPRLLSDKQMELVLEKFKTYGRRNRPAG